MLLQLKIENFRSIRTEQELNMVASSDKSHAEHLINTEVRVGGSELKLIRTALVYGPNASGKSNICEAVRAMRGFVLYSATKLSKGDTIPMITPFLLDKATVDKPCKFEVTVLVDQSIFRYGFSTTKTEITEEWLYTRKLMPKAPEVLLYHRVGLDPDGWQFGRSFKGNKAVLKNQTRENCLLLSKAAQENFELVEPLYRWFKTGLEVVDMAEGADRHIFMALVRIAEGDLNKHSFVGISQVADTTIREMHSRIEEKDFPDDYKALMAARGHTIDSQMRVPRVGYVRNVQGSEESASFDMDDESMGTKRFFAIAALLVEACRDGKTVFIDELDCSLHSTLIKELLSVLNDSTLGVASSQFVVTTHDTNLLDVNQVRRDQVVLVDKDPIGATELYTLWDVSPKPRLDASLEIQYLAGKFGAIPSIGNLRRAIAEAVKGG